MANQNDVPDLGYDPMSVTMAQDPYPLYHDMQASCPVNRAAGHGGYWVAANYETVHRAAADYKTFTSAQGCSIPISPIAPLYPIDIDPPMQTAYRRVLNPRFTVEALSKFRAPFSAIVHELIDGFASRGEVELYSELCSVAPLDIVLPLIGVPVADVAMLRPWVEAIVRYRAMPEISIPAGQNLERYMFALAARRRTMPEMDDVVGDLLKATIRGEPLSDDDIYRTVTIVLFGGLDTTTSAMLEGCKFFAENPAEFAKLEAEPSLWPAAVEEIVRYTSPAQAMARTVTCPVELGGVAMDPGDKIMLLFGAANHDPDVYSAPDCIELDRQPDKPHMAFGSGAHVCLGRNLARLEIEELCKALFRRIPDLKIKPGTNIEYHVSEARGMKALPCVFAPQSTVN